MAQVKIVKNAGDVVEVEQATADTLIAAGIAEAVTA